MAAAGSTCEGELVAAGAAPQCAVGGGCMQQLREGGRSGAAVLGSSPDSLESVWADLQCGAGVFDVVLLSLDTALFTVCYQPCAQG